MEKPHLTSVKPFPPESPHCSPRDWVKTGAGTGTIGKSGGDITGGMYVGIHFVECW